MSQKLQEDFIKLLEKAQKTIANPSFRNVKPVGFQYSTSLQNGFSIEEAVKTAEALKTEVSLSLLVKNLGGEFEGSNNWRVPRLNGETITVNIKSEDSSKTATQKNTKYDLDYSAGRESFHYWQGNFGGHGDFGGALNFLKFLLFSREENEAYSLKTPEGRFVNNVLLQFFKEFYLDENYKLKPELEGFKAEVEKYSSESSVKSKDFKIHAHKKEFEEKGISYLCDKRGLPQEIIGSFIQSQKITITDEIRNQSPMIVFNGPGVGEVREIDGGFKGSLAGSNSTMVIVFGDEKKININKKENKVILAEAAIDALTARALFPDCITASCNGAAKKKANLTFLSAVMRRGGKTGVAFDKDLTGFIQSQILFNTLATKEVILKVAEKLNALDKKGSKKKLEEQIYELIDSGDIVANFNDSKPSPHTLWFNNPFFRKEYAKILYDHEGKPFAYTISPPVLSFEIKSQEIASQFFNDKTNIKMKLDEKRLEFLRNNVGIVRISPLSKKDLNDEYLPYSTEYRANYTKTFGDDKEVKSSKEFPTIPDDLALSVYRDFDYAKKPEMLEQVKKYFPQTPAEDVDFYLRNILKKVPENIMEKGLYFIEPETYSSLIQNKISVEKWVKGQLKESNELSRDDVKDDLSNGNKPEESPTAHLGKTERFSENENLTEEKAEYVTPVSVNSSTKLSKEEFVEEVSEQASNNVSSNASHWKARKQRYNEVGSSNEVGNDIGGGINQSETDNIISRKDFTDNSEVKRTKNEQEASMGVLVNSLLTNK